MNQNGKNSLLKQHSNMPKMIRNQLPQGKMPAPQLARHVSAPHANFPAKENMQEEVSMMSVHKSRSQDVEQYRSIAGPVFVAQADVFGGDSLAMFCDRPMPKNITPPVHFDSVSASEESDEKMMIKPIAFPSQVPPCKADLSMFSALSLPPVAPLKQDLSPPSFSFGFSASVPQFDEKHQLPLLVHPKAFPACFSQDHEAEHDPSVAPIFGVANKLLSCGFIVLSLSPALALEKITQFLDALVKSRRADVDHQGYVISGRYYENGQVAEFRVTVYRKDPALDADDESEEAEECYVETKRNTSRASFTYSHFEEEILSSLSPYCKQNGALCTVPVHDESSLPDVESLDLQVQFDLDDDEDEENDDFFVNGDEIDNDASLSSLPVLSYSFCLDDNEEAESDAEKEQSHRKYVQNLVADCSDPQGEVNTIESAAEQLATLCDSDLVVLASVHNLTEKCLNGALESYDVQQVHALVGVLARILANRQLRNTVAMPGDARQRLENIKAMWETGRTRRVAEGCKFGFFPSQQIVYACDDCLKHVTAY